MKKVWPVLVLILLAPIAINFILVTPSPIPDNWVYQGDWLTFYGAFIGSILTVGGALYVMHHSLELENKRGYLTELLLFESMYTKYKDGSNVPLIDENMIKIQILKGKHSFEEMDKFFEYHHTHYHEVLNGMKVLCLYNITWNDHIENLNTAIKNIAMIQSNTISIMFSLRGSVDSFDEEKIEEYKERLTTYGYKFPGSISSYDQFCNECDDFLDNEQSKLTEKKLPKPKGKKSREKKEDSRKIHQTDDL